MKTTSQRFEELTRVSVADAIHVEPWLMDLFESLKIPDYHLSRVASLNEWETRAYEQCEILILARKLKHDDVTKSAAKNIGSIVTEEISKGNYKAPRIISEGLINLQNKKSFKSKSGRKSSGDSMRILIAFYFLKSAGIDQPSQAEVAKQLAEFGVSVTPDRLSKIFDELGLKSMSSDARMAASHAGKRKRRKS
jgi:hypothetical protein